LTATGVQTGKDFYFQIGKAFMFPDSDPGLSSTDPRGAAQSAGLHYVSDTEPGIRRKRAGKGFTYLMPSGETVQDEATRRRIRKLAIPPAYTGVWICKRADGHLQATGRDARGRKQYRYHAQFREVRESTKYDHMLEFARSLPAIRNTIASHMALRGLPRDKIFATVVHLLETTLIRVGNNDYVQQNKTYGLTTLRGEHVKVDGSELRFQFKGKSGKTWSLRMSDRRVAKIVKACQELPGQELFQYLDESGETRSVTSVDVNTYLHEITGREVTAKDFRTWAGTILAATLLQQSEGGDTQAKLKKTLRAAIERVAARLGNTVAICRKCYVHPEILNAYTERALALNIRDEQSGETRGSSRGLTPEEAAVLALLELRLSGNENGGL
jgi:DNA topoisomerase-1